MLINSIVVIISQYVRISKQTLHTLNMNNLRCSNIPHWTWRKNETGPQRLPAVCLLLTRQGHVLFTDFLSAASFLHRNPSSPSLGHGNTNTSNDNSLAKHVGTCAVEKALGV